MLRNVMSLTKSAEKHRLDCFFSLMILIGVDVDEFYAAFNKKDKKIRERIKL